MMDCKSLDAIIDHLRTITSENEKHAIVMMDVGIAAAENLELLKNKDYGYVCVYRSNTKKYSE
ncbi:MAG: hypothetical protein LBL90_01690 [Prevotellaceae bacterium]|jgi:hypothetical protein|nr:hypothetical protein [Prevotellaceae bacterium]